jgi:hypothetical protein
MPMPPLNPNSVEVHTSVTRQQRDYLMHLAATPGLTKTGTLTELLSYAAANFLTTKPYEKPGWEWIRPEGYYRYVNGERLPNGDWVALNPGICDIEVDGSTVSSERIVASLRAVAARPDLPKLRSNDTGMNSLLHTLIDWVVNDLYPPAKYAPRIAAPKMEIKASEMPRGRSRPRP